MNVSSYVAFPLYIGGVFRASITAYVKPGREGAMHMILGKPGWDAFLTGIERKSWPERETIATVAEEVEGKPEKRLVVPNVENMAVELSIVSSIPGGVRDEGETLENRRYRKHMARGQYRSQVVQANAQYGVVRAQRIIDEIRFASGKMRRRWRRRSGTGR